MGRPKENRPIRIAGASGAASDRRTAIADFARNYPNDPIDVIITDHLSEANMTAQAGKKMDAQGSVAGDAASLLSATGPAYEASFLQSLEPALEDLDRYGIRIAANAGGADVRGCVKVAEGMIRKKGLKLKVAYVTGDDVLDTIQKTQASGGSEFTNIYTKEKLSGWQFKPIYAQAYLGGLGISAAFANGADIVICGRTSDASTVIGSAFWWHDWKRSDLDKLANAFVAGHLLECSTYVCGGNFTGFKTLEEKGWHNIGFPIGEISKDGSVEMTKQINSGGLVSPDSCKSQLLYEIQGPQYYNSDVTAILSNISFHHVATNRVAVRGVGFAPPPPTTKVGITARGGFQAEISWFLVGLDIAAKARMLESQIRYELAPYSKNYSLLSFSQLGSSAPNPSNQNAATVTFRVLVQGREASHIDAGRFLRPVIDCIMEGYPGATFHLDYRQGIPKAIFEYYVTLLPQSLVNHEAHLPDGKTISIPPPPATKTFALQQPTLPTTKSPISLSSLGPTTTLPLGTIVHARSGDKGSDANVGFWVSKPAHYPWLRTLLSVEKIKELLGEEYTPGKSIDRFELPELWGVHFLLKEHLDRGVSCTGSVDFLGKNVAEYLRSKFVEIPTRFVNEARI